MSEVTGPTSDVPSGESSEQLLGAEDAAAVLGVQVDRVQVMVEEGLLRPVDPAQAEPQFRVEEVRAVARLGG